MTLATGAQRLPVDSHVHLHPCFALERFLDAARDNLERGARELANVAANPGVLLLTESWGVRRLRSIIEGPAPSQAGAWSLTPGADDLSVHAQRDGGGSLVLIEGRQIATRERLEVLALGCAVEVADGVGLDEAMGRVLDSGAVAVIPWGFGKWWLSRGRRVAEAIGVADRHRVFLGDNGGRLRFGPRPALFREGEALGFRVLPGSDPLPFAREVSRVGSYGFAVDVAIDPAAPARSIAERLASPGPGFDVFGRRAGLFEFARNQAAMQWRVRNARA